MAYRGAADTFLQKVRSADLQANAMDESEDVETVIVELDVPTPTLSFEAPSSAAIGGRSARFSVLAAATDEAGKDIIIEKARLLLRDVTGGEPRFLRAADSFIVTANGRQLRAIAASPLVQAVWPNRKLT